MELNIYNNLLLPFNLITEVIRCIVAYFMLKLYLYLDIIFISFIFEIILFCFGFIYYLLKCRLQPAVQKVFLISYHVAYLIQVCFSCIVFKDYMQTKYVVYYFIPLYVFCFDITNDSFRYYFAPGKL